MSYQPFPRVPPEILHLFEALDQYADELGACPETWDRLSVDDLGRLFRHQVLLMGATRDANRIGPLQDLYQVALRHLPSDARLEVLVQVTAYYESQCRRSLTGGGGDAFFVPFLFEDQDAQVVSTAALQAASLLGNDPTDAIGGRQWVLELARKTRDEHRKAMLLGGLAALGDALTLSLLKGCWRELSTPGQEQMLRLIDALPWAGVAEFLMEWAEDAIAVGREDVMATALGALIAFARNRRSGASRLYRGWPVRQIQRNVPAWAYAEGNAVVIERQWTLEQFARHIEPRLLAIAVSERQEPRVADKVIEEWCPKPSRSPS